APVRWQVSWKGPAGAGGQTPVALSETEVPTDWALLPPSKFAPAPVLALATWDSLRRSPLLRLYHARTGDEVRQLRAHTQPIRCLAAAPDGRLLASAAGDRTWYD